MILEQGRIIEFDRYMQSFFLDDDKKTNYPLSCAQACHLVEKLNLWILFVMQSNGKRRICNVERNGRSLDSEASPSPFIHVPYVPLCHCFENMQLFFLALALPLPKYILLRWDCTRRGFSISNDRGFRSRLLLSRTWARWVVGACKFVIAPREVLLIVYPKRIQSLWVELNYFETLGNWMLISRLFSVIVSTGAGKCTVSLR